jgi:hypothetical protein
MSQNADSTSPTLPTARKARRASQRNRPVLVSSSSQKTQESQEIQVETLEPETNNGRIPTQPLAEAPAPTEVPALPAKERHIPYLPSFFSKVKKTGEEAETSQEEIVKARLARAQKTTPAKAEVTSAASETKKQQGKPASGANRTTATSRPNGPFKTRHFIGMALYLLVAETLLPLETNYFKKLGIEQTFAKFTLFNLPMVVTTSVLLNLATLVILLFILVKLDLVPSSIGRKMASTARAGQQRSEQHAERPPQQTVRQGVKGEDDDLYYAYRSKQRREKKH